MKYILITALLLCSIASMAQEKTTTLTDGKGNYATGTSITNTFKGVYNTGDYPLTLAPVTKNNWTISNTYSLTANRNNKMLISITDMKSDSTYRVWFDKKSIIWTSDSTFTLKPKN